MEINASFLLNSVKNLICKADITIKAKPIINACWFNNKVIAYSHVIPFGGMTLCVPPYACVTHL